MVWYLYLLQWHLVQIRVKVIPYFLQCKSLQPWTGMLVCCSSSIGHCFPVHAPCGVGLVQAHIFCPNEIVDLVLLGSSSGTTALSLTHVQGKSHPSVESRWAQRRWSCLPSEKFRHSGCMAMACCPPSLVTPQTLCEKRGEGWAQSGKLSPSPLNWCTSGSLSS